MGLNGSGNKKENNVNALYYGISKVGIVYVSKWALKETKEIEKLMVVITTIVFILTAEFCQQITNVSK